MFTFHIVSLFPKTFDSYLKESITGRAFRKSQSAVKFYNPRDLVKPQGLGRHRQVDDRSYGGGPGMVLIARPILDSVQRAKAGTKRQKTKVVLFSPSGRQFTNRLAAEWVRRYRHLILICGHYEGIDARVQKILRPEIISVGPYILTGGELPAMVVIDAVNRQIPGVLGGTDSLEEKRLASSEVYTRPETLVYRGRKHRVPAVLLSGDHRKIAAWRRAQISPQGSP